MKRFAENQLSSWAKRATHKPLILLGARQVGKTWLMKNLGKNQFSNMIYLNFKREKEYAQLFDLNLDPNRICSAISTLFGSSIIDGETLLIFDEIQDAPNALTSLKYFAEDRPNLHVIAAGSLLGVTMEKGSFPVGKVEFLFIKPMNFHEYLLGTQQDGLYNLIQNNDYKLWEVFKEKLTHALKTYYFVGGMPEAVQKYVEQPDNFELVRTTQQHILLAYTQDFAKHAPAVLIPKIVMVWDSIVSQLSKENKKFVFGLVKSGARARDFEQAIDWLVNYGLIHKIYAVNKIVTPLDAYRDLKNFKLYVHDVGLLSCLAQLNQKIIIDGESIFQEFKGALTEQFVVQELKTITKNNIHFWTNETGKAEVDFIFQEGTKTFPIEVKAAENLQSKSLKVFREKNEKQHCYRTSLSNFRVESWMTNVPLFALSTFIEGELKT